MSIHLSENELMFNRTKPGVFKSAILQNHPKVEMIALGIVVAHKRCAEILVGTLGSFAYNLFVTLGQAATIRQSLRDRDSSRSRSQFHLIQLALIWYGK